MMGIQFILGKTFTVFVTLLILVNPVFKLLIVDLKYHRRSGIETLRVSVCLMCFCILKDFMLYKHIALLMPFGRQIINRY